MNDKKRWLSKRLIYQLKGAESPCCTPARSGWCAPSYITDVWLCDRQGQIHPAFNVSPVAMNVKNIGEAVNDWPDESDVYE